jgi:hypothetical protein
LQQGTNGTSIHTFSGSEAAAKRGSQWPGMGDTFSLSASLGLVDLNSQTMWAALLRAELLLLAGHNPGAFE